VRFHRGRLFLAALILAGADRALVAGNATQATDWVALRSTVAMLVAANLAWLAFAKDAAVFGPAGRRRLGVLALEAGAGLAVVLAAPVAFAAQAADGSTVVAWPRALELAAPVSLTGAFCVIAARGLLRPDASTRGLLWAEAAAALAIVWTPATLAGTALFGVGGLVLGLAVIEASYALAYHDGLTGLPGRRAFDEAIRVLEPPYTIAMVDVDHFKQINDRFGHDVGDQVLRMVATRLGEVAGGGRAFRYGGEEFAIVFAGRGAEECVEPLEAIRRAVEETSFALRAPNRPRHKPEPRRRRRGLRAAVTVTVSIGVAESRPQSADPARTIQAADQALYKAKRGGRNRLAR
jgi:diguanylate cyclase (GGDEF)-like protein